MIRVVMKSKGPTAEPWRTRYRWWLIVACLAAGMGVIGWWQLSARAGGRFTREQYDRIRLGTTPAEVASSIGRPRLWWSA